MAKDPFKKLDPTLKSNLDNMSPEQLRVKASEVALYQQARRDSMEKDPAVVEARQALKNETKDYRDEIKGAGLEIKYITHLLEQKGKL